MPQFLVPVLGKNNVNHVDAPLNACQLRFLWADMIMYQQDVIGQSYVDMNSTCNVLFLAINSARRQISSSIMFPMSASFLWPSIVSATMLPWLITRGSGSSVLPWLVTRGSGSSMLPWFITWGSGSSMLPWFITWGSGSSMLPWFITRGSGNSMLPWFITWGSGSSMLPWFITRGSGSSMLPWFITRGSGCLMLPWLITWGSGSSLVSLFIPLWVIIHPLLPSLHPFFPSVLYYPFSAHLLVPFMFPHPLRLVPFITSMFSHLFPVHGFFPPILRPPSLLHTFIPPLFASPFLVRPFTVSIRAFIPSSMRLFSSFPTSQVSFFMAIFLRKMCLVVAAVTSSWHCWWRWRRRWVIRIWKCNSIK